MSELPLRILSGADVRRALPMKDAVEAMKTAFRELSEGKACVPQRTQVGVPEFSGDALFMPAYSPALKHMGLKVVTLFPGNVKKDLPFIQALVALLDATTGSPVAVMNGTELTALRTGAASGAATDVLAREDAQTVAVIGAGAQACTQLEAVCAVRSVTRASVFDVDASRAEAFAGSMSDRLSIDVRVASSPRAALSDALIICTATTATTPVFEDSVVEEGAHLNAIGSYKPGVREIPSATVSRARVVVDQVEAAWEEAGDLILARDEGAIGDDHVHAELGDILNGKKTGRQNGEEVTFFKSVGVAIQDLAAAYAALRNAERLGLGTVVDL